VPIGHRDLQNARRFARAAACDDFCARVEIEQGKQPRESRRINPAQWMRYRLAHRTDNGRAQIGWPCRAAAQDRGCRDNCCGQGRQPNEKAAPHQAGARLMIAGPATSTERSFAVMLARARCDDLIGIAFLSKKAEHGIQRRKPDDPFAKP
jgi:hypothetical protein